ncbi:LCP family protein [Bifidobacterium lemurum]|nr:LCP family protein [Bifidobacterium lemurum]
MHPHTRKASSVTPYSNDDAEIPNLNQLDATRPRHSTGYRVSHRVRTVIACVIVALLCCAGTATAATLLDLDSTIQDRAVDMLAQDGDSASSQIIDPNAGQSIEFVVLGQDTREGDGNAAIGGSADDTADLHNADTTMVVQVAADRSWINLVSIPRDSIVDVPSCETSNGTIPAQYDVMFNSIFPNAYSVGGDLASAASCTVSAINSLTGLDIQNFIVVDFQGLSSMIDALGGVDICIPVDTEDAYTGLSLTRGLHHLDGTTATQYARMRHGTGTDGTDIMRTTRQQYLIKQLLSEAMSKNLFTQTSQLYQLAKSALQSLNISRGLANTTTLAGLAMSLADFDMTHLYAQTVPVQEWALDTNRRVWTSDAETLWAKMREGKPITIADDTADSSTTDDGTGDTGTSDGADASTGTDGTDGTGDSGATDTTPQVDPTTGLITLEDGTLIDPDTGGIVDPENGSITDATTGEYIGIADRYLNVTVCAVTAQE